MESIKEITDLALKYAAEKKGNILISYGCYVGVKILVTIIQKYLTLRRHKKFVDKYGTDPNVGILGLLPKFGQLMENDEEYLEYRLEQVEKVGINNAEFVPPFYMFMVSEPKLGKFLMNLPPNMIKKGGLVNEVFLSDENGFRGNLVMEEGETWQIHRKIISKMLHLDILDTYIEPMDISALSFVNQLSSSDDFQDTSQVLEKCTRMTFEIICKCLMGEFENEAQTSSKHDDIYNAIGQLSDSMMWRLHNVLGIRLLQKIPFGEQIFGRFFSQLRIEQRAIGIRDKYIDDSISRSKLKIANGEDSSDLATLLIKHQDEKGMHTFSDGSVRCQLYGFLFAGHETTASTMQWILYYLGEKPEWIEKINEEFESIGGKINARTLKKVPVTEAVIKEVLRLAHIVEFYVPRQLLKDVQLPNGDIMPKDMEFIVDFAVMMRNEGAFPNPIEFNPARFLNDKIHDMDQYWFTPFAAGRRNCIGQVFAMQEMKIVLLRLCSLIKIENQILVKDKTNRPPNKLIGITYKVKTKTLNQKFVCE